MPTYRLTIEYEGTRYHGWQEQKNARSVAGELRRAIEEAGAPVRELGGSGRTDAGGHALAQGAHPRLARGGDPPPPPGRPPGGGRGGSPRGRPAGRSTPGCGRPSTCSRGRPRGPASIPATTRSLARTSTRSRAGARRSPSASSGG